MTNYWLEQAFEGIKLAVKGQADDENLWVKAESIRELHLQNQLKMLHALVDEIEE